MADDAPQSLAVTTAQATAPPDPNDKKLETKLHDIQKEKVDYMGRLESGVSGISKQYSDLMKQRLAQEGVERSDMKPWDTQKELSTRQTNLWEEFGSPAFLISMLGSAFSARPMNSALTAGAAVIQAANDKNEDGYKKAFQAWKDNTDLAIKRSEMEHREFQDIHELYKDNVESFEAAARMHFAKYGDERSLAAMETGHFPEVAEMKLKMDQTNLEARQTRDALVKRNLATEIANQDPDFKSGDPQKISKAIQRAEYMVNEGYFDASIGGTGGGTKSDGKKENDIPYEESFGVKGTLNWMSRKVQDLATGTVSDDTAMRTRAEQEWKNLRYHTLNALSAGQSDERLKMVQQRVQSLFPEVEHLFTGPAEAVSNIKALRDDLEESIKENASIIMAPSFDKKDKEKARMSLVRQKRVVQEMDEILDSIGSRGEAKEESGPWNNYSGQ